MTSRIRLRRMFVRPGIRSTMSTGWKRARPYCRARRSGRLLCVIQIPGDVRRRPATQTPLASDESIMPSFSLAALNVLELAPPALIDVAAACGYQQVGLRLLPAMQGGVAYPLMEDEAGLKETLARLDATGI